MKLLSPFGTLYGRIMDLRNLLYDHEILKSYSLGARTISVGNLTTGGTGKTPLVGLIAGILAESGEKVCILTRGYGRENPKKRVLVSDGENLLVDASAGGDEPVELASKLNGKAIIVADADRVAAAKWARENFDISAFILDDGFQHRRAKRGLDIVCIDATSPCGNGRLLPAGTLRESFRALSRADAIVITRANLVNDVGEIEKRLRNRNTSAPIFRASTKIESFVPLEGVSRKQVPSRLFAFCGIGNPDSFFAALKSAGFEPVGSKAFPDHHRFTQTDVLELEKRAVLDSAEALVTTAKDAVKLERLKFSLPCYVALAETVIDDPEAFREVLFSS